MLLIRHDVKKVKDVKSKSAKCSQNVFTNEKLLESVLNFRKY